MNAFNKIVTDIDGSSIHCVGDADGFVTCESISADGQVVSTFCLPHEIFSKLYEDLDNEN